MVTDTTHRERGAGGGEEHVVDSRAAHTRHTAGGCTVRRECTCAALCLGRGGRGINRQITRASSLVGVGGTWGGGREGECVGDKTHRQTGRGFWVAGHMCLAAVQQAHRGRMIERKWVTAHQHAHRAA